MALFTEDEIRDEVFDNKDYILSQRYPDELAHEYADSALPVYNSAIHEEWNELPVAYQNNYQQIRNDLPDKVEDLMIDDLYLYYLNAYQTAIHDLIDEQKEED